ncbi:ROK family protein [Neobacillus drentensis]|uniref:ROK family protein n=1 Tax=Neobacillus drentensis TaxID=220684 RepID=UPI002FFFC766
MNSNYLAIDIGGSCIKWGILDRDGTIYEKGKLAVNGTDFAGFYEGIRTLILKSGCRKIGISSPGTIDRQTKTISGSVSVPCIKEGDWVTRLERELGVSCSIENDANCATLAEMWIGNARGYKDFLNIVIGTGIGSTLVMNNKIFRGANLYGSELGYLIRNNDGKFYYESEFTSTKALVDRISPIVPVKNGLEVFQYLDHPLVLAEYENFINDLAILFYNAVHMYDPEIVLVGGAISTNKRLIEDLKNRYEEIRREVGMSSIKINLNTCRFYNDSNLIGAVYHFINEFEVH